MRRAGIVVLLLLVVAGPLQAQYATPVPESESSREMRGPPPRVTTKPTTAPTPVPPRASPRVAGRVTVCAAGCDFTNSQLQTALETALDNDEVLLESGQTYRAPPDDGYLLGPQCKVPKWNCIVVRTGVTSTGSIIPLTSFPADGVRMDTSYRTASAGKAALAKIVPRDANAAAIHTVYPGQDWGAGWGGCVTLPCVGNGWTLKWLEFPANPSWPKYAMVRFGTNKAGKDFHWGQPGCTWPNWPDTVPACWSLNSLPNNETQDTLVEVPKYLSLIQCDVHGDPMQGNHQGLLIASADTRVIGNSFTDIKSTSETQAIIGLNGVGPVLIENNFISATGENSLWGGDDQYLRARATVTGSPTTTSLPLGSPKWFHLDATETTANFTTDIWSGVFVGVWHAGQFYSGMTCTLSGTTATTTNCALSPALPVTPSAGDVVEWQWIHGGLTFRYNHYWKDTLWMAPSFAMPTNVVATGSTTGGSLAAGTYCYRLFAYVYAVGEWRNSATTAQACGTVASGTTGSVTVSFTPVAGMQGYRMVGRASGSWSVSWEISGSPQIDTGTNSTGADGISGDCAPSCAAGVSTRTTYWIVKNNFELKSCEGAGPMGPCLIEYNLIEYSWCCTQDNIVTLKAHDQSGGDTSGSLRNVTFRNNWVKHGGRAISLVCSDGDGLPSGVSTDVTIQNNLFTDLNHSWVFQWEPAGASYGHAALFTSGHSSNIVGSNMCIRPTYRHNTFLVDTNDMHGPMTVNMNYPDDLLADIVIRDNIMGRNASIAWQVSDGAYGYYAEPIWTSRPAGGSASWNFSTTGGGRSADHNAWPDGSSAMYGATEFPNSLFPTQAQVQSYLVNYTACQTGTDILACALNGSSPLDNAASDATDVGANVAAIKVGVDIALSGNTGVLTVPLGHAGRTRLRLRGGGA